MRRVLLVVPLVAMSWSLSTAQAPSPANSKPNPAPQAPTGSQPDPNLSALEGAAIDPGDAQGGDYVPCEFDVKQLLRLRAAPEASTLTGADSEALKMKIIAVARAQETGSNQFATARTELFIQKVAAENFTGKTQSQVLETVMGDYATVSAPKANSPEEKAKTTAVQAAYFSELHSLNVAANSVLFTKSDQINFALPFPSVVQEVQNLAAPGRELAGLTEKDKAAATTVANDLVAATAQSNKQQNTVVDATRQAASFFLQPRDVACAMQVLTYKEAQYSYGTIVAKNYIVVQMNVRNLNATQEFQIHDGEFATDSDPSGRHGRFFSGSDKRVVRSFSVAQESFDARNIAVNTTAAVGALFSSMVPIYKGSFADAVGVLTGGAIPGLGKVWKDRTTEQLNLLNDTALSPGTNGTTIPKNGVAQFMMFVPSRVFESGWWTLPCANITYLASKQDAGYLRSKRDSGQTGLDVDRLMEPCLVNPDTAENAPAALKGYKIKRITEDPAKDTTDIFQDHRPLPFKKWSGNMLSLFRELSFAAVSGSHTVQSSDLAPGLTKWNTCVPPFDKSGNVVFDGTDPITCVVGGQNLGTVKALRLRNADNQSDSLDFPFAPTSGDPSTGTVKFDAPKLAVLAGTSYSVLMTDSNDKETKTNLALHLIGAANPVAVKISTGTDAFDFGASPLPSVTIFGSHLDGIAKVTLALKDDAKTTDTLTISKHDGFSLPLDMSTAAKIKAAATKASSDVTITLVPSDVNAKPIPTSLVLAVKNSATAH
jgi:hypothetical protein